jgi:ABC-type transport system involved in multi-copper enzyme maturation permease subunit
MTATTTVDRLPAPAITWLPDTHLVKAERMKLTKRWGLMIASTLLTSGAIVLAYVILISLHASDAVKHPPAGGMQHFRNLSEVLVRLGAVAAILIGATAGAGDLGAGMFRNLVVTGRSRLSLFLARIPGGLIVLWPLVAIAYLIVAVGAVAFAGSLATPGIGLMITTGLWLELGATLMFLLALGLGSLVGSRSTSISVLVAANLIVTPILTNLSGFTWLRQLFPTVAIQRLEPLALLGNTDFGRNVLPIAWGAAVTVVIVWSAVAIGVGAWRTMTRDA